MISQCMYGVHLLKHISFKTPKNKYYVYVSCMYTYVPQAAYIHASGCVY